MSDIDLWMISVGPFAVSNFAEPADNRSMAMIQEPELEVPTIYQAYIKPM
jgi:hypothetical protein